MPDDHIEKKDMSEALEKISHVAVGVNERKRADENSQMLVQLSQTLRTLKNNYNVSVIHTKWITHLFSHWYNRIVV